MAFRLKTPNDIRRYLANLINRVEKGEMKPEVASKLGFLCNVHLKSMAMVLEHDIIVPMYEEVAELEKQGE